MKKADIIFFTGFILLFLPFFASSGVYAFYHHLNADHPYLMSFIKFAILATIGEMIAHRIKTGLYYAKGFGFIPRALIWGIMGIMIKMAFVIFAAGAPVMLATMGVEYPTAVPAEILDQSIAESRSWLHFLSAFAVSTTLNLFFAPVFMTFHKITDTHILTGKGKLNKFFTIIPFGDIMANLNWSVMWNFVFKKTIILFWIPAQTITFMLPPEHRILFAALLSIVLGVFLAVASLKSRPEETKQAAKTEELEMADVTAE
ncbi:MAG: Mpv17/PMP22 family protein [Bacteroidales bacterium]|nr:Mpv17/PMP22 family protein [Bacteroidales bacterium]